MYIYIYIHIYIYIYIYTHIYIYIDSHGRRPCQPAWVSQQEGASQPTGRRESANRKARVSQQEGRSQPTRMARVNRMVLVRQPGRKSDNHVNQVPSQTTRSTRSRVRQPGREAAGHTLLALRSELSQGTGNMLLMLRSALSLVTFKYFYHLLILLNSELSLAACDMLLMPNSELSLVTCGMLWMLRWTFSSNFKPLLTLCSEFSLVACKWQVSIVSCVSLLALWQPPTRHRAVRHRSCAADTTAAVRLSPHASDTEAPRPTQTCLFRHPDLSLLS